LREKEREAVWMIVQGGIVDFSEREGYQPSLKEEFVTTRL